MKKSCIILLILIIVNYLNNSDPKYYHVTWKELFNFSLLFNIFSGDLFSITLYYKYVVSL